MKQADGDLGTREPRQRGKNRPVPQGRAEGIAAKDAREAAKAAPAKAKPKGRGKK